MIGPADFTAMRLLVSFGWLRILIRGETKNITLNEIDKSILWLGGCIIITGVILNKNMAGFINRAGYFYNIVGTYFFFRMMILDATDFQQVIKMLCLVLFPLAILMTYEKVTHHNLFSYLGGVREYSMIRDGKLRAQGPFMHPILAGTMGATTIPMILSLWWASSKNKKYVIIGIVSCVIIMVTPSSSGPLMAFSFILMGFFCWRLRNHMRLVRWSIVIGIILLQLFMTAPVWFIIGRISGIIGGTGYHRSALIDSAFRHLDEWWFVGTNYTRHWMVTGVSWSPDHTDITNQYIKMGVLGGLPTMSLFILMIVRSYKAVGKTLKTLKNKPFGEHFTIWCFGTTLFAHTASFISVSYFDQIIVFFYFLIAVIAMARDLSSQKSQLDCA